MEKLTKTEAERRMKMRQECTNAITRLSRLENEVNEVKDFLLRLRTEVLGDNLHDYCMQCVNWNDNPMMCTACGCRNTSSDRFYFFPDEY